jgi:glycosyltransferase involved in cell wall biosynthesis
MRISVIIPTLNEAADIKGAIDGVRAGGANEATGAAAEVIVADGGSNDGTPDLAEKFGARVVKGPAGRGLMITRSSEGASALL